MASRKKGKAPKRSARRQPRKGKALAGSTGRGAHKRNPELIVFGANPEKRRTWTKGAKRFGKEVDAVYYVHMSEGPRVHRFAKNGVRMEALPDGSIRIFHPEFRIWEDM